MSHENVKAAMVASVLLMACASASAESDSRHSPPAASHDVCAFDASFHNCLARNASALVKQPADRASQVFQVAIALADGTRKTVTVLSTNDGTMADARRLALEGNPGARLGDLAMAPAVRGDADNEAGKAVLKTP